MTVAGETLGQRLAVETGPVDRSVVKPFADPLQPKGGLVALFGSLAPKGAIFKRSAADPKLFERGGARGRLPLARRPLGADRRSRP